MDSKDLIFKERLESILRKSKEIESASKQVDALLSVYSNKLDLLDSSSLIERLTVVDSLEGRVKSLEMSQDEIFSLNVDQQYEIKIGDKRFTIRNLSVKSEASEIYVNTKKVNLKTGDPVLIDGANIFIELIQPSKGVLFGKGKATYKIFSRY